MCAARQPMCVKVAPGRARPGRVCRAAWLHAWLHPPPPQQLAGWPLYTAARACVRQSCVRAGEVCVCVHVVSTHTRMVLCCCPWRVAALRRQAPRAICGVKPAAHGLVRVRLVLLEQACTLFKAVSPSTHVHHKARRRGSLISFCGVFWTFHRTHARAHAASAGCAHAAVWRSPLPARGSHGSAFKQVACRGARALASSHDCDSCGARVCQRRCATPAVGDMGPLLVQGD